MTTPDSVVDAVQQQMGCHDHWVCPDAQRIADAAWAAAYPEALRDAAENLHLVAEVMATTALSVADARETLRSWADESEAK